VRVRFKRGEFPSLIDTGAEFSCIRRDVLEQLAQSGEKFFKVLAELSPGERAGLRVQINGEVAFSPGTNVSKYWRAGPFL
jgi:hypothetical protein